jgi:hypothetical protein
MRSWYDRLDFNRAPNLKRYLHGLRQYRYLAAYSSKPYNYYLIRVTPLAAYLLVKVVKKCMQLEFDRREQPNIFVPKIVYRVRRQHYVYWEMSRLARGLPKTFTYSTWD